ncbi:hypothetical protein BAUCODRAFT_64718 [Baudoinia panamericana UAMH 10762]|uniref:Glutathione S-transferase n=1 Tax=Baudoinia panamericana (strain UAMH 10762) TaxID=717646 RepID=M2N4N6_BAUPA|nr:uncharacterized protein BAUCODRAFT_64718 [Baudoinia panamericana UAMH 10762]EMC98943.1 hypothetical protein BAUCODRAFT_64718 [Baudoinia panamericana UAMH 10762]
MPLTIHHLQVSQSERILFLCEELHLPYDLKLYPRRPLLAGPEYKALHPIGAAPVITITDSSLPNNTPTLTLAESGAIVEYILTTQLHPTSPNLVIKPGEKDYAEYVYWLHFPNGTLQPSIGRYLTLLWAHADENNDPTVARVKAKMYSNLSFVDAQLQKTGAWIVGSKFTAADVMIVFSLTTIRRFGPVDLSGFEGILGYLRRIGGREGYVRAMERGDPGMEWRDAMGGASPKVFEGLSMQSQQGQGQRKAKV